MGIRFIAIVSVLGLWACGTASSDADAGSGMDELSAANQARRARILSQRGKADYPQATTTDVCEYYELYDDGVCDTACAQNDKDCQGDEQSDDSLAWLCEFETGEANNICVRFCANFDPDCDDEALADVDEDVCDESYDNADGMCNIDCFPQDDDCIAENDLCQSELRYGDGQCDDNCGFTDPDCDPSILDADLLTSEEIGICSRLPTNDKLMRRDLATSICMGRAAAELPACVAQCANQ
ncbi:MAG: hypothetical protein VX589_19165 [Myxococcota bacterium]|nr:hypothetical protein [Myxococcota bacterium]